MIYYQLVAIVRTNYHMSVTIKQFARVMHILGLFEQTNNNYEQMKQYYLMAIEHNNVKSMNKLGTYYRQVEKDYEQMPLSIIMRFQCII